jgi:hypothetical protein
LFKKIPGIAYFDFSKYSKRLKSRASKVRATADMVRLRANEIFVACEVDGEVVSVLQLEQKASFGDRAEMRISSVAWPVKGLGRNKFSMVPPGVVRSRLLLRSWLDTQGYNLEDEYLYPSDPYGI